ncbi:MAG: FCD domain-containing protein, partial [Chloroflexota bacterium]
MSTGNDHADPDRIPPLAELSDELGVSVATLREQLQVARVLGFVEVKPKSGIRRLPYTFGPSASESLSYAIALDRSYFESFADLRKKIEADYWYEAVERLSDEDKAELNALVQRAMGMLMGVPIQIPHKEHRQLHLAIFKHVQNPFVTGILEAYWDAYEEIGLNRYEHIEYLQDVWRFHQTIVSAIVAGNIEQGHD